jgi:uroporphyrinogen-III synthase
LFEIEAVDWQAPDAGGFDGLLLTSANAVRHGGDQLERLKALPVFAVGDATAEAARQAGFSIAHVGDGGVERLLAGIAPELRLLHLCGGDRAETQGVRQPITQIVVYRSTLLPAPDLRAAEHSVALIHSPRAGRRFRELVDDRTSIVIAAISPAANEAVGSGWQTVEIAEQPCEEALLALAARLCNKPSPQ